MLARRREAQPFTLPPNWNVCSIGDLAAPQENAIVDGPFGSNLKTSNYVAMGVPVLQGGNVTGDSFNFEHVRYVPPAKAQELRRSLASVGDLLVVKIGSVGYSAIIDDLGSHEAALIPANLLKATFNASIVSTRYVHHYLTSDTGRRRLVDAASQTAQPALTLARFKALSILLPPLPEQRHIAEILDTADWAIGETEALISKLKQMKTGLMHDLLTRGLDERGQLRDPEAHPEQFKDSPLGRIPREWEAKKLSDVTSVKNGTTPSREEPSFWADGTIPWLPTGKVNDRLIYGADEHITENALQFCSLDLLPEGSVLVAMVGQGLTRGKVAYLATSACINQNFAAILPCPDLNSQFLFYYLDKNYDRVRGASRGSNQQALNCSVVAALQVVIPPLSEQHRIAEILDAHDARIRAEETYRDKLKLQKKGLMDDLLTGRVRVKTTQEVGA